jgi:hypothetical protein
MAWFWVHCASCTRPVVLPWKPLRPKLCEKCYGRMQGENWSRSDRMPVLHEEGKGPRVSCIGGKAPRRRVNAYPHGHM